MVKASSKAPYCLICGKQFVSDKTHFHRKCFNNSEFAKVLGKDEVNNGS